MAVESNHRPISTVHGYPRQGADRQLKKATESFWAGKSQAEDLLDVARELRLERLAELRDAGIEEIPSNDFSLYDHVLDTAFMLGAIPARFRKASPATDDASERLDRYFAMARGSSDVAPLEMTKWFDTNYHYLVPELDPDDEFILDASKPVGEFEEALKAGVLTRPVILGPVTFLLLAKAASGHEEDFEPLSLLDRVLPCYVQLVEKLQSSGAEWIQFDEPALVADQSVATLDRTRYAYDAIAKASARPKLLVATYFDRVGDALGILAKLPIEGIGLDFTGTAHANLAALKAFGGLGNKRLVAGVVNGRNIWATDLQQSLETLTSLLGLASQVDVGASCSLLHVPLDVRRETNLDPQIATWLSFARQKLDEISILARGFSEGSEAIESELQANRAHLLARADSLLVRDAGVRDRASNVVDDDRHRASDYVHRSLLQHGRLRLPSLPTTTIGSFPQTPELRRTRASFAAGRIDQHSYDDAMASEIREVVALQDSLGLDVLVHGEPERNDMVQYFAEQLKGFIATSHGWVQSYGTRYVRPPIILGDVSRPEPMTVRWATYAQQLTKRPMKGMLTGPVTMLAWSFVRDDQPLGETARQVALALRDEVNDLEQAGIGVIQVDEPALRETLPLRQADRAAYLEWAVDAFRLTTSGVRDETQIHTHMCYAEFGDVLSAIIAMDADVISLEAARSKMAIVSDLARAGYPSEVGPGVWDIHSPRIPSVQEITGWLRTAVSEFPPERLWVNPDCGLKTRGYAEVKASLANLVEAAHIVRAEL